MQLFKLQLGIWKMRLGVFVLGRARERGSQQSAEVRALGDRRGGKGGREGAKGSGPGGRDVPGRITPNNQADK